MLVRRNEGGGPLGGEGSVAKMRESARGVTGPRAAGLEEGLEQSLLLPFRDKILGVPLHSGQEAAGGPFERLDEVVRRGGQRHKTRREVLHALVVA